MDIKEFDPRKMGDIPKDERPRERLLREGASSLSNADLVAILLRTGVVGKNVHMLAREFCDLFNNEFHTLTTFHQEALIEFLTKTKKEILPGLGVDKVTTLLAAMEFGRRVYKPSQEEMRPLKDPILRASQIANFMFSEVAYNAEENFWALYLDAKQSIIHNKPYLITRGLDTHTLIDPKSIYKNACMVNATSVIVVHNHPSGDVTPSEADIRTTNHLIAAGKTLGIPIKDHIIIGRANIPPHYASLRARALCNF